MWHAPEGVLRGGGLLPAEAASLRREGRGWTRDPVAASNLKYSNISIADDHWKPHWEPNDRDAAL